MAELVFIGVLFFLLLVPIQLHIMLIHPLKTSLHRGSLQLLEPLRLRPFADILQILRTPSTHRWVWTCWDM